MRGKFICSGERGEKEKERRQLAKDTEYYSFFFKSIIEIASIILSKLMVFSSYHHPVCLLLVFIQLCHDNNEVNCMPYFSFFSCMHCVTND